MAIEAIDEDAGLRRQFEVTIRFAPMRASAAVAAKSIASVLDSHPQVPVRLFDVTTEGSRVHVTLSVCLGTVDDVKAATPSSRRALTLLQDLIDSFAAYDPAFVYVPISIDGSRTSMLATDLRNLPTAV